MKKWNAWLHTNHAVLVKHLQSEAYSDTCQTSSIKLYAKIVNGWKPLPISAKKSILDVQYGSEHDFGNVC